MNPDARDYLFPEHVREIASYDLRTLVSLALSDPRWLRAIQDLDFGAAVIVGHRDWDPALRPIVKAMFATAHAPPEGGYAIELRLAVSGPEEAEEEEEEDYIPWTLLAQNWERWNRWLVNAPRKLLTVNHGPVVNAWDARFPLFAFELLQKKADTRRGRLLMRVFIQQINAFCGALQHQGFGLAFAFGPMQTLVLYLATALRFVWRRPSGPTAAVELLLEFLTAPGTPIAEAFQLWDGEDSDALEARMPGALTHLLAGLPHFFLAAGLTDGRIYATNAMDRDRDMTLKFGLPSLLPLTVDLLGARVPPAAWQVRLAEVANAHITGIQDVTVQANDPALVAIMHAYADPVRGREGWDAYRAEFGWPSMFD
jgi:hypothetical protein